jgi:hypothetical protein
MLFLNLAERHHKGVSEWPTVSGSVVSTNRGIDRTVNDRYATLTIRFEYLVQGALYQGNQMLYVDDDYKQEAKYPPGSPITVFYSPHNPSDSYIIPGLNMSVWDWLGIAAGILTFILLIAIVKSYWDDRRKIKTPS